LVVAGAAKQAGREMETLMNFEKYSERVRGFIQAAQTFALTSNHQQFTPEHLLKVLVDDEEADLSVRAWRFSYNARGIIEMPNRLRADKTAVIMVHPWGIDDGQGWRTPEPAGACDFCTPTKNLII